jgi:hypothetical protein
MAGLWLRDGLHLNITDEAAEEIAEEFKKNGSAFFGEAEVRMVLPRSHIFPAPRAINRTESSLSSLDKKQYPSNLKSDNKINKSINKSAYNSPGA